MRREEDIINEAYQVLKNQMDVEELIGLLEVEVQVALPEQDNERHYTVFFERAADEEKWTVRNIINVDKLQKPTDRQEPIE